MKTNSRSGQSLLTMVVAAFGLVACTTTAAKPDGGTGTGTGGTGGRGGTGGSSATGTGGSTGAGGLATNDGILCPLPEQVITNFTPAPAGDAAVDNTQVRFGTFGTSLSGGEYAYPPAIVADVSGGDWHMMGSANDFAGFALYFDVVDGCNRVDASAYDGIQFKIWGTIGSTAAPAPAQTITFGVSVLDDAVASSWLDSKDAGTPGMVKPGRCFPTSGTNQYYHPGCADPMHVFTLTGTQAAPQTITVKWADFMGGTPKASVTPTDILSIYWQLPAPTGAGTATVAAYPVDIHVDDLAFIPKP